MSSPIFFPTELWSGKQIQFTYPSASTWTIGSKIQDEIHHRFDRDEAAEGESSFAYCTFTCHQGGVEATVQVAMQIPYIGSEFLPTSVRQRQASVQLRPFMEKQLEAHESLRRHRCQHVPQLIGKLLAQQDLDCPVPGGSVCYLVVSKLPGVVLGLPTVSWGSVHKKQDGIFWKLERAKRDRIRVAFEAAYKSICEADVHCSPCGLHHLSWDEESAKIYIFGEFSPSNPSADSRSDIPKLSWGPTALRVWGLAEAPIGTMEREYDFDCLEEKGWLL